ncbi:antitoxin VapB family protein [Candidatus Woesearchaeota archaeon]|nr:antitoxin VapB family protein [Candidatus Woesearchaeota archaeon]
MGTKTINLMDDAYEMLNKAKLEGESFSDVVRRILGEKRMRLEDFAGAWKDFDTSIYSKLAKRRLADSKKRHEQIRKMFEGL